MHIIYGKAGCGKTTYMASIILKSNDYVVLAATHSAVNTIYNICKSLATYNNLDIPNRDKFKTIYSFFRINYIDNYILGPIMSPNIVFIDEFSLINKKLLKSCLKLLPSSTKIYVCGDPLQLNAIKLDKQYISLNKLIKYQNVIPNIKASIISHLSLNIMGTTHVDKLSFTHRSINLRSNKYINELVDNIYIRNVNFNYKFIEFNNIPKYLDNEYILLGSNYSTLQKIYTYCHENDINEKTTVINQKIPRGYSGYKQLYLAPDMKICICDTDENGLYYNGEIVQLKEITPCGLRCTKQNGASILIESVDKENTFYPITPANILTIHKSQGCGFDNIIVCIDEMFHITMLYTAITRAKTNVLFYTKEQDKVSQLFKSAFIDEFNDLQHYIEATFQTHSSNFG